MKKKSQPGKLRCW